ncbi:hypothetical protein DICPUDRAFT_79874 [Dictyostelium purpureum]|uniref:Uncharacterized protein n=1 Tax=Dictyostelium purpureum TaxID=5786 RepID=F0ZNW2_DICPU|nr:uncharacterized protein DICPUDRAFT_79874 [Dictyostelium purpureum]EGC34377.1 hypothetical protein DICPUDRAFT_79874 [Dictyostelium purpureum]|eukprot:XP_003289111.1 hypothetical protein DICPUDRAFT_79874 [Dictyostelium purpureum]
MEILYDDIKHYNEDLLECSSVSSNSDSEDQHHQKEINILIIGGVGVGKSTFISSILNYISFENLNDAIENGTLENLCPIPTNIKIMDSNYIQHDFNAGKPLQQQQKPNEKANNGETSTKECKQYKIKLPNNTINFYDTPGIGDIRGSNTDSKNFEMILEQISKIKKLHGVFLLLNPDELRSTVLFKYFIFELFTRLHESAKKNLYFCFTKTRGKMYRPSNGLIVLNKQLKEMYTKTNINISTEGRVFCFDNESFSFLMANKFNNAHFDQDEVTIFSQSWDKSSKETAKLLERVTNQEGYCVKDTICINSAYNVASNLRGPIIQCLEATQIPIKKIDSKNRKLGENHDNIEILKKKLLSNISSFEIVPLEKPFLFCGNKKCCKSYTTKDTPTGKIKIKGCVCSFNNHPNECFDISSKVYWRKNISILGYCYNCGCSYKDHIILNIAKVKQIQNNSNNIEPINNNNEEEIEEIMKMENKEKLIDLINIKILNNIKEKEEYENDFKFILNSLLKISIFKWHYSLDKSNNHEFKDYIEKEIQIKENQLSLIPLSTQFNIEIIKMLKDSLKEYKHCVKQIKNSIDFSAIPSSNEIFDIFSKLPHLNKMGSFISKSINNQKNEQQQKYHQQREQQNLDAIRIEKIGNHYFFLIK